MIYFFSEIKTLSRIELVLFMFMEDLKFYENKITTKGGLYLERC